MQTYLPYRSYIETAQCLDYKRLGNQRLEALQILKQLLARSGGWIKHPTVQQWNGYEYSLCTYAITICDEWIRRGYKDTIRSRFEDIRNTLLNTSDPPWLGYHAYHASHRSNLMRKNPEYYSQFGWTETPDLPYIWPSKLSLMS